MRLVFGVVALFLVGLSALPLPLPALADAPAPESARQPSAISSEPLWNTPIKALNGDDATLARYRGKPLIVYFWATWCGPCQTGVPYYSKLHATYAAKGLSVVGIAIDNADSVRKFVARKNATNPTYYAGAPAIKLTKSLGNKIGAMPYTVFVKADGTIVAATQGATPDDAVEQYIAELAVTP